MKPSATLNASLPTAIAGLSERTVKAGLLVLLILAVGLAFVAPIPATYGKAWYSIDGGTTWLDLTAKLTTAPGNGAPLGGLKVTTANGWFAARPSGTENIYKIYAESFKGQAHLEQVQSEAKTLVDGVLG